MTIKDPFSKEFLKDTLSNVVKNLEKRWGLTLVSFLPTAAQERIRNLQIKISKIASGKDQNDLYHGRSFIKFYSAQHFHNTHFTLRRSNPGGPVRIADFVKDGHHLYELFNVINRVCSQIQPITAYLNRLIFEDNGLGIILVGACDDEDSIRTRQNLLRALNQELPDLFNISGRKMDSNASQLHKLHCTLGYLKRPLPANNYQRFVQQVENLEFDSITYALKDVDLVHHRYRSLNSPSEGSINFPLGEKINISAKEFTSSLNLI